MNGTRRLPGRARIRRCLVCAGCTPVVSYDAHACVGGGPVVVAFENKRPTDKDQLKPQLLL